MSTRFHAQPSDLYQRALRLLKELEATEHTADRAYAEAVADTRRRDFAEAEGVRPARGHVCIDRLKGQRCQPRTCPWPAGIPGADHCSEWRKDGKTVLIVCQPYQLSYETVRETAAFCAHHGLEADIHAAPAWHFPGATLHITYRKKPHRGDKGK